METLDEIKKKAVVQISNAVPVQRDRLTPAPPAVSGSGLPSDKFPGIDVGKVRVNTSTEQEFKAPSMGQIPVGGGYIALSGGAAKPVDTSPAQVMGPSGGADLRLPTVQDYKAAQAPIFLGRMTGDQGLSPKIDMQPVSLERNKEAFSAAEGASRSSFNSFMGRAPITTMAPATTAAPTEDYSTRSKRLFSEVEAEKKKVKDEFGLYG